MATYPRKGPGALVGRPREVTEMARALDRVGDGQAWLIQLIGEPGIGKSRLLAELAGDAQARGFLVLDGRAAEFEQDVPFGVMIDALNDSLGTLEPAFLRALDDGTVRELAAVFPSLSQLDDAASRPAQAGRYRFHYAVRAILERLAARRPVLLALDDIHWADPASFALIAHLLRRFRGPLLMALALRHTPARLAAAFEDSARAGFGTRLDLAPLTPAEADSLIDPDLDSAARGALYRESGGNPFYLEQLVRGPPPALPTATAPGETEPWSVPPPVTASIDNELERIKGPSRAVLDAAAMIGESFEPELAAAIAEQDVSSTLSALDELLDTDIIRPTAAARRFRFRHPIVRRAVYDGMRPGWRLGAHARAAAALIAAHAPASICAHHVERSAFVGDENAIGLLIDAARSVALRAPLTAGRWLLAAIRLLPAEADPDRRLGLLVEAATALTSGGAYGESLASLEEALTLAPAHQAGRRADLIAKLAYAKRRSGRPFDSRTLLESALAGLSPDDSAATVSLRLELAFDRFWHGQFASLGELATELLAAARERADPAMISLCAALRSLSCAEHRVADALAALDEARTTFDALTDEQLADRIYVAFYLGLAEVRLECADDAHADVGRGLDVARMTGQAMTVTPWPAITSQALLLKGRVSDAARLAHGAIDTTLLAADDWRAVWALEADALAAFWAGDTDRALASAREMLTRSDRAHRFLSGAAAVQLAGAEYIAGDPESAVERLTVLDAEPTRRLLDLHAAHGWELLTRAQLALGHTDLARDTAGRAWRRAQDSALPQRMATVRCAEASVLLARGDPDAVQELTSEALALAEAAGNPLLSARSRALSGLALAATGQDAGAIAELEHAQKQLSSCGAVREANAAARELRRLGRRVPRRVRPQETQPGLPALSPREREVAAQVAAGKTNREVGDALFLSEKTIESHLARIYKKLDVHSRAALAALIGREAGPRDSAHSGPAQNRYSPAS